jgi:hypothetical protein
LTPIHTNPAHPKPAHRHLFHRKQVRPIIAIGAFLLLPALYGCQGHKIVARINGDTITDEQYSNRLERVVPQEFQPMMQTAPGMSIDAGAVALVTAIRERSVDILAKQKNAMASNETVDALFKYQELANPNLANLIKNGTVQEEEVKHNLRIQTEAVGIGTDGAQVDAKELTDAFNLAKNSPNPVDKLDISEKYGMRLLRVKDETDGLLVLGRLKASGDWSEEARKEGDQKQLDGTDQTFPVPDLQRLPALYDVIKTLSPGQFAPAPITLTVPQQSGTQSFTVVAQLTKKIPAHQVTLDEVRAELTARLLQKKFPQWQQHFVQTLNDFLRSKDTNIEIDIERYRPLVTAFFKTPPEPMVAPGGVSAGPGGASAPPAGASMDAQSPTGTPHGATPPAGGKP